MRIRVRGYFQVAIAVMLLAGVTSYASAASSEPLTAKEVRKAEAEARTAADHLRLAAYYRSKAAQAQANLSEAEEDMAHWSGMADRTKIPNPWWSARARAGMYRAELKEATKRAVDHEKRAESIEAGANR